MERETLDEARWNAAETEWKTYNLGIYQSKGQGLWNRDTDSNVWLRPIHLSLPYGSTTPFPATFRVRFRPGTSIPLEVSVLMDGEKIGYGPALGENVKHPSPKAETRHKTFSGEYRERLATLGLRIRNKPSAQEGAAPAARSGTLPEAPKPGAPALMLTQAQRRGPPTPEDAPAMPGARAGAVPEPPKPMLPGVPFQPVTAEEVAAAVEADKAVQAARGVMSYLLATACRDPAEAARRLAALEKEPGGTEAVAPTLARQPGALGKLRGSGWLVTTPMAAAERDSARKAVGWIGPGLAEQRKVERQAERLHRDPIEAQRRLEAVEVPGLSPQARQAAEAVAAAGATVGWREPAPWDADPPAADDIARAARVAPVWAAIQAQPGLHDELQRFMAAARQRLPNHDWEPRGDLKGPEQEVQALSGALHAAEALYQCHPGFQAYAAAEPQRQAQAAREQEAAARAAEQARLAAEEKAQADAKGSSGNKRIEWHAIGPVPDFRCLRSLLPRSDD